MSLQTDISDVIAQVTAMVAALPPSFVALIVKIDSIQPGTGGGSTLDQAVLDSLVNLRTAVDGLAPVVSTIDQHVQAVLDGQAPPPAPDPSPSARAAKR